METASLDSVSWSDQWLIMSAMRIRCRICPREVACRACQCQPGAAQWLTPILGIDQLRFSPVKSSMSLQWSVKCKQCTRWMCRGEVEEAKLTTRAKPKSPGPWVLIGLLVASHSLLSFLHQRSDSLTKAFAPLPFPQEHMTECLGTPSRPEVRPLPTTRPIH